MSEQQIAPVKSEPRSDRMRVVDYHEIADHVYEVVTESAGRGRLTRKVLVLPGSVTDPSETKRCDDR
jgi:hypothetical protein